MTVDCEVESPLMKNAITSETTPLIAPAPPRMHGSDTRADLRLPPSGENSLQMLKEETLVLARYAFPVLGTQLLEYFLIVAPVVSIGHLSTNALAAITLGSMTATVSGFGIIQGLTCALDTLLPSAWTSTKPQLVGLWSQRMCVVVAAFLIPTFVVWFNAEAILLALRQEPEIAYLAALYLKWVSLGLPAYGFNNIIRRYFQAQNLFSIPTRVVMIVTPINALLNYVLVWGPEPIRLGFIGAPLATAISFNLISILSIIYGIFFIPRTAWHPISMKIFTGLGVLTRLGMSGVGQLASEYWAWEGVAFGASLLGPVALASQSVLLSSTMITFQAFFSIAVAASVRIGNLLGERKARRAGIATATSYICAFFFALFTCTMFTVFRKSWAHIFNDDPEVVSEVAAILPLCALFQMFDCMATVSGGILRARGRQLTGAVLTFSAYYIVGIPVGMLLAFKYHMRLYGIWIGLALSLLYCGVFGIWLAVRTDWQHEVDKVQNRLEEERERDRKATPIEEGEREIE
ncbi:hypothetical protein D9756_001113 [Leucocoprinus leucothites]|uniref:MATE efflux family protein n=1 Tax=Leucocoprinus leucothites TaxID=201217 RepID=A0A8H5GGG7_9AGAR|nr:hypothetical protein D9756_001113 [Leucoagaricus leucothites]